jgi:hypothetical protein
MCKSKTQSQCSAPLARIGIESSRHFATNNQNYTQAILEGKVVSFGKEKKRAIVFTL